MKDLTCGDLERQNKALNAADEFLRQHKAENGEDSDDECKTKSDRTVISKGNEKRRLDPSTALGQMVRLLTIGICTASLPTPTFWDLPPPLDRVKNQEC